LFLVDCRPLFAIYFTDCGTKVAYLLHTTDVTLSAAYYQFIMGIVCFTHMSLSSCSINIGTSQGEGKFGKVWHRTGHASQI